MDRLQTALLALALAFSPALANAEAPAQSRPSPLDAGLVRHAVAGPAIDTGTSWLRNVRVRKGAGFEVRRPFGEGDDRVVLGLRGPILKRKRVGPGIGLTFEVRF